MHTPKWFSHPRATALAHALALGAVSFVFSEGMFWSHWRQTDTAGGTVLTWLVYTVIAYLVFAAARVYVVGTSAGIILIGALYGWLVEGGVAGTVFDTPLGFAWTGLAWHALLSVWVGWHVLPSVLRRASWPVPLLTTSGLGVGLGIWSSGFVHDAEGGGVPGTGSYAAFVVALTVVLGLGYLVLDRTASVVGRTPSRGAVTASAVVVAAWFVLAVAVVRPWAALVLPVLLALPIGVLRAGAGRREGVAPVLLQPGGALGVRQCVPLVALPVMAVATYAALEPVVGFGPVIVTYVLTVPAGIVLFGVSLRRMWRRPATVGSSDDRVGADRLR